MDFGNQNAFAMSLRNIEISTICKYRFEEDIVPFEIELLWLMVNMNTTI